MWVMNLHALNQFLTIVDHRSITAAAEALGLSQSALTKSLKRLEDELGVKLLERLPRGVIPTRYGEILARQARLADLEIQRGLAEIDAIGKGTSGILRIGGTPIWTITLIPQAAILLRSERPNAHINITMGMPDTLMQRLRDDDLDLIAVGTEYETGLDLAYERLALIEQTVYASVNHPLARKPSVEVSDLMAFPWVVFSHDTSAVSRIVALSEDEDLPPPDIGMQTNSIAAMMSLTSRGEFVFGGSLLLKDFAAGFNVAPLPIKPLWRLPAGVLYRRSARYFPLAVIFLNCLRSLCRPTGARPFSM